MRSRAGSSRLVDGDGKVGLAPGSGVAPFCPRFCTIDDVEASRTRAGLPAQGRGHGLPPRSRVPSPLHYRGPLDAFLAVECEFSEVMRDGCQPEMMPLRRHNGAHAKNRITPQQLFGSSALFIMSERDVDMKSPNGPGVEHRGGVMFICNTEETG